MKVAVIGSRSIRLLNLSPYLPPTTTAIISGGAVGVDRCAARFAREKGIPLTELLPDYAAFSRSAPLVRDREIVHQADLILAFWDGFSRGTAYTVRYAQRRRVPVWLFVQEQAQGFLRLSSFEGKPLLPSPICERESSPLSFF